MRNVRARVRPRWCPRAESTARGMPAIERLSFVVSALVPVAVIWLFGSPATAILAVAAGVAMAGGFVMWMALWPQSYGRFFRWLAGPIGGPPGQQWAWERRTRGCVLVVIGVLGLASSTAILVEPGPFSGGRTGGIVFAVVSALALALGTRLTNRRSTTQW